jgi:two-component system cell cycle sensor histidine kinase/response regulator CckA
VTDGGGRSGGDELRGEVLANEALANEALANEAGSHFRTALAGMLDGFSIQSAVRENGAIVDLRVEWLNDAACRMFGLTQEQFVGRSLLSLFPAATDSGLFEATAHVVETGRPLVLDAVPWVEPDGRKRAFDIRTTRFGDGCAIAFRDVTERRRTEESIFKSAEMLKLVVDTIPQRIFWKDRDSVFLGANAPFAGDAGYDDPAKMVGLTDFDMPWAAEAEGYRADDRAVMETGIPKIDYEEPQTRPDGREGWLRTSKVPLRAADGKVIGVLGTYQDITEHKSAEEALRRSEQFLDSIVENIPDMIFVKDARDGRFVRFNRAGERLMGHSREEMVGKTDHEVSPRAEADLYAAADREVIAGGVPLDIPEEEHSGGPLGRRILHTKKIPIHDEAGRPAYLLGISEDITERKQAEEALRQSEERYRHITETITDYVFSVVVTEGQGVATTHGPGCVAVTGYTSEEMSADPNLWLEMVVPEDRPHILDQSSRAAAGQAVEPLDHRIVRKDGAVRWVRSTLVGRLDESGEFSGFDGLIQDITERRALQEQLLQAQKMEGIGRLAGGIAHDFNNLLTAILGFVEMARLDLPAELPQVAAVRADLDEIGAAGNRAASLTRQLLAFASKQIVAPIHLDLSVQVADLLKMLRPLLGENIAVETVLEPGIGMIEADPSQIQQLLVNLSVNARDAMPDGGRLIIETAAEDVTEVAAAAYPGARVGRHVRLSVTDTGCGMNADVRSHLFEPFFTTKEQGKGTGLGLATCHGIVRQMGGHIRVFSEPGNGTTFRIFLPHVEGAATAAAMAPSSPTPTGTETVLVVEDEPAVRRLAVLALRAQGYTVIEACDGVEALEIAGRLATDIDLVISDVVMPGLSGPELLGRLARLAPGARRLLVSGHAESDVLPAGLADVGATFLPKPFTPERLARKVREVLDEARG